MNPKLFVLFAMAAGCAMAESVPLEVIPVNPKKTLQTFRQDIGVERGDEIPAGGFNLPVLEESPDGQRFRVRFAGKDVWLLKRDVRPTERTLSAREMCSTSVASVQAGATRNANDACLRQK